jgi:DNA-binding NarL/FixJ family response regulator
MKSARLVQLNRAIFTSPAHGPGDPITDQSNLSRGTIRILAVDDFAPYRLFISSMLQERPDLQVICGVSDGLEAVEKAQELQPDLILMDIGLPGINGIEAARRIRTLVPNAKIIFLTQESSPEVMKEAKSLGASGYVLKADAEADLLTAVEVVLGGKHGTDGHER